MRNNKSYKGKKKSSTSIESLDSMDFEEEGFIEGDFDFGIPVAAFSFGSKKDIDVKEAPVQNQNIFNKPGKRNPSKDHVITSYPKGITPPVDGEQYTVQRCHQYRPSTLRKLNELKAKHPDVNVYLNTIIDEAIVHYYNYIFNDGGDFNDGFQ
jgi:hypothetical protein